MNQSIKKGWRCYNGYSQLPTSDLLFTHFCPVLGPRRLTSTDRITQAPLSSGFQWVWPMGGINGRRRKISELGGKRSLGIYFCSFLGQVTFGRDCVLLPRATPSVGLFLSDSLSFSQVLLSSLRPKDANSFFLLHCPLLVPFTLPTPSVVPLECVLCFLPGPWLLQML